MSDEWADPPDRINLQRIAKLLDRAANPGSEPIEAAKAMQVIRSMLDEHKLEFSDILHLQSKSDRSTRDLLDGIKERRELNDRLNTARSRVRALEAELEATRQENRKLKKTNAGVRALRETVDVQARQIAAAAIRPVDEPNDVVTRSTIQVYDLCTEARSVGELVRATGLTAPGVRKIASRLVAVGVLAASGSIPIHYLQVAKPNDAGRKFIAKMDALRRPKS